MTAKDYLKQVKNLDLRLQCMAEQLQSLRSAATSIPTTISDMPGAATPNVHQMEDVVVRIVGLENDIRVVFNQLADINETINSISDPLQQATVVKRYISNKSWDDIAYELGISTSKVYRLHRAALVEVDKITGKFDSK